MKIIENLGTPNPRKPPVTAPLIRNITFLMLSEKTLAMAKTMKSPTKNVPKKVKINKKNEGYC
jgi:hypothetical protein